MEGGIEMFDIDRKHYIFELSSGKTFIVFYRQGSGICISELGKNNVWLTPQILASDAVPQFSACIDGEDNIHILYQNEWADINLLSGSGGRWSKTFLLKSKRSDPYNKLLRIKNTGSCLLFTYVLKHNESMLLSYQLRKGSEPVTNPEAIDRIDSMKKKYFVVMDGNIPCVFYTRSHKGMCQAGWKSYDLKSGQWSDFTVICEDTGDISILSVSPDRQENIHMWMQKRSGSEYELVYTRKDSSSGKWSSEMLLASSVYPYANSSHVVSGERLVFYQVNGEAIYYWISPDGGLHWNKRERLPFAEGESKYCISYDSNSPGKLSGTYFYAIPGIVSPGFKLAFVGETAAATRPDAKKTSTAEENKVLQRMQELNIFREETEKSLEQLREKIADLEIAIEKCDIKASLLGKDLSALKKQFEAFMKMQKGQTEHTETTHQPDIKKSKPMLPGTGFKNVTLEYITNPAHFEDDSNNM